MNIEISGGQSGSDPVPEPFHPNPEPLPLETQRRCEQTLRDRPDFQDFFVDVKPGIALQERDVRPEYADLKMIRPLAKALWQYHRYPLIIDNFGTNRVKRRNSINTIGKNDEELFNFLKSTRLSGSALTGVAGCVEMLRNEIDNICNPSPQIKKLHATLIWFKNFFGAVRLNEWGETSVLEKLTIVKFFEEKSLELYDQITS